MRSRQLVTAHNIAVPQVQPDELCQVDDGVRQIGVLNHWHVGYYDAVAIGVAVGIVFDFAPGILAVVDGATTVLGWTVRYRLS